MWFVNALFFCWREPAIPHFEESSALENKKTSFPPSLKSYDWLKSTWDFSKKDPICFLFTFWF